MDNFCPCILRYGGLIVLYQTSPESPDIFLLLHSLNTAEITSSLKSKALGAGVTETEFLAFMVYSSGSSIIFQII